jgi:cytochrome c oxidase assembly protein subunit 11
MTSKRITVLLLLALVTGMAGLAGAAVPLYRMFCEATGYGGTPRRVETTSTTSTERLVTVRFDASLAKGMPWQFRAGQREMKVHLGEDALAWFTATNVSDKPVTGTATFNVTPDKAGRSVNKVECFCFTEQRLEAGQTVQMPVSFHIDPGLAPDVNTVTLAYTFFRTPGEARP